MPKSPKATPPSQPPQRVSGAAARAAHWALAREHMRLYPRHNGNAVRELDQRGLPVLHKTYVTCRESTGGKAPRIPLFVFKKFASDPTPITGFDGFAAGGPAPPPPADSFATGASPKAKATLPKKTKAATGGSLPPKRGGKRGRLPVELDSKACRGRINIISSPPAASSPG